MTDLEVYRQPTAAVALTSDIDSWTQVAGAVIKLANEICNTPFVPDGLRGSAPATAAAILAGRELGLGPFASLGNIHVIKGKTGLSALLMRALIMSQGHDWQDVKVTDSEVTVKARRRGESEWTEATFTAAQARTAHIDLSGYPQDKLYARATSRLARRKFADVIAGMPYSAEELEDDPGDTPATEAKPTGRVTAAEITGRTAPQTASPATPAPRAPEPQQTPPAEQVAGEAPDEDRPPPRAASGQIGIMRREWERLGYNLDSDDDRKAILHRIAQITQIADLTAVTQLTQDQAKKVIDTLKPLGDVLELADLLEDVEVPDA